MKRREFIKGSIATTGLLAVPGAKVLGSNANFVNDMPMNIMGRTGMKVSKLGFGCGPLGWDSVSQDEVNNLLVKSADLGINYFDTAPNYGNAEERMGQVIPLIRDKIILVSKTEEPDYDGTWRLLEQSLKHLQTDYLDIVHIHNFGSETRFNDIDFTLSEKGALGALLKAKSQGLIRYVGASGHLFPSRFHRAIEHPEIDVLMLAVNFILKHKYNFEDKIWLKASLEKMGLAAMKVFGGSVNKRDSKITDENRDKALGYAFSLPGLSTAVIGMRTEQELIANVKAVKQSNPLTDEELFQLSKKGLELSRTDKWMHAHGAPYI